MRYALGVIGVCALSCRPDLDSAIAQTMADSRRAIGAHGATDTALKQIQGAVSMTQTAYRSLY